MAVKRVTKQRPDALPSAQAAKANARNTRGGCVAHTKARLGPDDKRLSAKVRGNYSSYIRSACPNRLSNRRRCISLTKWRQDGELPFYRNAI